MISAELSPAYVWDCHECGRENFQRAISVILDRDDEDDADVLRKMHGLDDAEPIPDGLGGNAMTRPNRVTCRHCNTEFKAVDVGAVEDDE